MTESDESREQWGNVAAAWEKDVPRVAAAAGARAESWLLGRSAPKPGERLLEVACGTGRVGVAAAGRLQPGGSALLSDFAQPMVDAAYRRAHAADVTGVDFAVLDAQDLRLDGGSFDVVICGFGLMLMPEPARAAAEARRVLRPGGRFAVTVWGEEEANPWLGLALRAVMEELGAPEPEEGMPSPFALGSPDRLERLLGEAGFPEVDVERVELVEPHESFDAWWSAVESSAGPLVAMLKALPDDTRAAVRERARGAAAAFETSSGGLDLPAAFNGVICSG